MRKITLVLSCLLVLMSFGMLAACGSPETATPVAGGLQRPEPPAEYAGKSNPLDGNSDAIEAGKGIYNANCASCHGETGMGDGPAAKSLDPKPLPLAQEAELSDAYLYWRISDGGAKEPFRSVMPAWKSFLGEEQIWQVIAYLRTLMA